MCISLRGLSCTWRGEKPTAAALPPPQPSIQMTWSSFPLGEVSFLVVHLLPSCKMSHDDVPWKRGKPFGEGKRLRLPSKMWLIPWTLVTEFGLP